MTREKKLVPQKVGLGIGKTISKREKRAKPVKKMKYTIKNMETFMKADEDLVAFLENFGRDRLNSGKKELLSFLSELQKKILL